MGTHKRVVHGALDHAELAALGLLPEALLDFSSNINPFGPPPGVRVALAELDPAPYPDRSCLALRTILAARHGCPPQLILAGNGANELIHVLARALLHSGDPTLVIGPTYGEYAHASRLAGAQVVEMQTHYATGFRPDSDALTALIARLRPRLTWLCSPNNPTGVAVGPEDVLALADRCAAHGSYLVVDQSYRDLQRSPAAPSQGEPAPNLIRLHSLTKSYALAGLRLGYLLASADIVARIGIYQPAWSVSSAAQAAGLAALADEEFLKSTLPQLWAASDTLVGRLREQGRDVWRTTLPFLLVRSGNGAATRAALLRRGCVVRDCASFGLPAWVRVAPRPRPGAVPEALWRGRPDHAAFRQHPRRRDGGLGGGGG
ncbi:MAG: histidinol-phosphate aminotransferase family protein [Blastochloris sp.]|nr:histidinol-phosphate aminotransferase family protein [Blastochloris sp.]